MGKNLIPQIAELLGVELGEEFALKDNHDNSTSNETYEFSENALLYKYGDDDSYCLASSITLCSLLSGDMEVAKLPWKPKRHETYYGFSFKTFSNPCWCVNCFSWDESPADFAKLKAGWIFRTRAEANAALPAVAKELGVEYEL